MWRHAKESGMVNSGAPFPPTSDYCFSFNWIYVMFMFTCRLNLQTGHVQDEEVQNRSNNDIQCPNALPSTSQTQTHGHGAYSNGTQNNDVITCSTNIGTFYLCPCSTSYSMDYFVVARCWPSWKSWRVLHHLLLLMSSRGWILFTHVARRETMTLHCHGQTVIEPHFRAPLKCYYIIEIYSHRWGSSAIKW